MTDFKITIYSDDEGVLARIAMACRAEPGDAPPRIGFIHAAPPAEMEVDEEEVDEEEAEIVVTSPVAKGKTQRKRNAAQAGVKAEVSTPPSAGIGTTIAPPTFTQKDIGEAITNLSRTKGLPVAANIVKTTNVAADGEPEKFAVRVADIPVAKYADVMARIQEALGATK